MRDIILSFCFNVLKLVCVLSKHFRVSFGSLKFSWEMFRNFPLAFGQILEAFSEIFGKFDISFLALKTASLFRYAHS